MLQQKPFLVASHEASSAKEYIVQGRFFDTFGRRSPSGYYGEVCIDHKELMTIIERRVKDSRLLRLIGKWLSTGAVERDGRRIRAKQGTPQEGRLNYEG